jgi:hypothetical protein
MSPLGISSKRDKSCILLVEGARYRLCCIWPRSKTMRNRNRAVVIERRLRVTEEILLDVGSRMI